MIITCKPRGIHLYISLCHSFHMTLNHGLWRLLTVVPLYCSEKYMKRFYFFFLKKSKVWLTMDVHEILRESVSVCGCMCMWTGSYLIITSGRFSGVSLWEEVLDFSTLIDVLCWWSSFSSVTMTLRLSVWYAGSGTILQMLTGTAHPCCFSLWRTSQWHVLLPWECPGNAAWFHIFSPITFQPLKIVTMYKNGCDF